jgi:homoserine O-acetyltransferase
MLEDSPEDSESEVKAMNPGTGQMIPFPSIWGHWAGGPGDNQDDVQWLDDKLSEFFDKEKIEDRTMTLPIR